MNKAAVNQSYPTHRIRLKAKLRNGGAKAMDIKISR